MCHVLHLQLSLPVSQHFKTVLCSHVKISVKTQNKEMVIMSYEFDHYCYHVV